MTSRRRSWGKSTLFEDSARVPLLVHAPGMKAEGRRSKKLVELVDLYPTLADLSGLETGLEADLSLEGTNFARLLDRPGRAVKNAAYTQTREGRTVRTGRWRYTEWDGGRRGTELYDHRIDSGEHLNLAELPEFAGVAEELRAILLDVFPSGLD